MGRARGTRGARKSEKAVWHDRHVTSKSVVRAESSGSPRPSKRVPVVWPISVVVSGLVGIPGRSGLAWDLQADRRSEVFEQLLKAALAIPARSEVHGR